MLTRIYTGNFKYYVSSGSLKIESSKNIKKEIPLPGKIKVLDVFRDIITIVCVSQGVTHKIEIQPKTTNSVFILSTLDDNYEKETQKVLKF